MNEPPAAKIIFKLLNTRPEKIELSDFNCPLPEKGAINNFRLLPLPDKAFLLTFDLEENLSYEWEPQPILRLDLHDEHYYDESEWDYRKGLEHHSRGELREALSAYRKAVFKNRRHGNAYFKAGQIRFAMGQYRLAEINFNHALRLKSDSLNLYRDLAALYEKTGKSHQAEEYRRIYHKKKEEALSRKTQEQTDNESMASSLPETDLLSEKVASTETLQIYQKLEGTPSKSSLPLQLIFYVVGIFVLSVALIIYFIRLFAKRQDRYRAWDSNLFEELSEEQINMKKEQILKVAKLAARELEYENAEPTLKGAPEDELQEEAVSEGNLFREPEVGDAESRYRKEEMARHLSLGIGEIDLALNLKAHQRKAHSCFSLESQIDEMVSKNYPITEIAREMNLGKGEVELFLTLKQHKTNTSSR
ncbi:MAG: hypothetical protein Kow0042_03420 [Calditrichia bacterium]